MVDEIGPSRVVGDQVGHEMWLPADGLTPDLTNLHAYTDALCWMSQAQLKSFLCVLSVSNLVSFF